MIHDVSLPDFIKDIQSSVMLLSTCGAADNLGEVAEAYYSSFKALIERMNLYGRRP